MALSAKKQKIPPPGPQNGISYRDAVTKRLPTTKKSLLDRDIPVNTEITGTADTDKIIRTKIWRHARSRQGFLLDISKVPTVTDVEHLTTIAQQYSGARNFYGIKFLGKSSERYIEIYPSNEILKTFATEGVYYEKLKIRLLPCSAVEGEGKVIQLSLTEIPLLPEAEILGGLRKALTPFGTVIDIGLRYSSTEGWFLGTGYAIIQQTTGQSYATLQHTISWNEEEYCYATFPNMPTWCRYCHSEGHTKYECQKASAGILCYSCDKYGHRAADCNDPKSTKGNSNRYKKPRKTYNNKIYPEDTPDASEELMKSKWAPQVEKKPTATKSQQEHHPIDNSESNKTPKNESSLEKGVMRETNMSNDKKTPNTEGSNRSSIETDPNIMELDSDSDMDDLDYDPDDEHATPQSDEEDSEDGYGTDTSMQTVQSDISKKSQPVTPGNLKKLKTFVGSVSNFQGDPAPSPKDNHNL